MRRSRSSRRTPSRPSSWAMRMETAGCVVLGFSAARRKLRRFATQRKVSIVRKSIIVTVLLLVVSTDKKKLSKVIWNDDWTGSDRNGALRSAKQGRRVMRAGSTAISPKVPLGSGLDVRLAARAGALDAPTAGLVPGYVQGNLAILPR